MSSSSDWIVAAVEASALPRALGGLLCELVGAVVPMSDRERPDLVRFFRACRESPSTGGTRAALANAIELSLPTDPASAAARARGAAGVAILAFVHDRTQREGDTWKGPQSANPGRPGERGAMDVASRLSRREDIPERARELLAKAAAGLNEAPTDSIIASLARAAIEDESPDSDPPRNQASITLGELSARCVESGGVLPVSVAEAARVFGVSASSIRRQAACRIKHGAYCLFRLGGVFKGAVDVANLPDRIREQMNEAEARERVVAAADGGAELARPKRAKRARRA